MNATRKISILGAGNVGATIAYTLTLSGIASELVMIDVNHEKAKGEAMDIIQGTPFCSPVNIYAGDYSAAAGSDVVIITAGAGRKPGQTRLDLAQGNINIINMVMPNVVRYAPDAVYVVVSNPVDILTYHIVRNFGLKETQVIGSGTMLDSSRLRTIIAERAALNPQSVHAYVFGEHGDTAMIPWSLTSIAGMTMRDYCLHESGTALSLEEIEEDVRTSGGKVIQCKGATYYAVSMAVNRLVDCIVKDSESVLTVSGMINGRYGVDDVCLSLPFVVGAKGIIREFTPPLTEEELSQLHISANALKTMISSVSFAPDAK